MPLDPAALAQSMFDAAKIPLKSFWKDAKPFAEAESKAFVSKLALIEVLKTAGKITKEEALIHIDIQKSAYRTVLLSIKGLGLLAVEGALNAALGVIRETVNKAIGWELL